MKKCNILSYQYVYDTVMMMINMDYWQLEYKQENPSSLSAPLNLNGYQARENCHKNRGFLSSGSAGEMRLNQFLVDAYAVQDTYREGCIVLFRFIKAVLDSREGRHFPYVLAKAILSLLDDPQVYLKPQIRFEGEKSVQLKREVDLIYQSAKNVISHYRIFYHPNNIPAAYQAALLRNNLMSLRLPI